MHLSVSWYYFHPPTPFRDARQNACVALCSDGGEADDAGREVLGIWIWRMVVNDGQ